MMANGPGRRQTSGRKPSLISPGIARPGVEAPIQVAPARRTARPIFSRVVQRDAFGDGDDEPDAGGERFLDRGQRFHRRRHGDRGDGAGRQHGVAAGREHRHAGGFRRIRARGGAADDVGAVGAHQRGVRAAHAAGDALHDDRRGVESAGGPLPTPSRRGGGVMRRRLPLPLREGVGGGGRANALPTRRNASSRSSVTSIAGWRSARIRRASAAPRPTRRATTGTRRLGVCSIAGRQQPAELGQIGDAGEDVDQHRAQRRPRRDPLQHAHQRAPDCRASGRCGCRRSSAASCRAR